MNSLESCLNNVSKPLPLCLSLKSKGVDPGLLADKASWGISEPLHYEISLFQEVPQKEWYIMSILICMCLDCQIFGTRLQDIWKNMHECIMWDKQDLWYFIEKLIWREHWEFSNKNWNWEATWSPLSWVDLAKSDRVAPLSK